MPTGRALLIPAFSLLIVVAVCAWFTIGIRQAHDTAAATSIITNDQPLTAPEARHAASLLHAAAFLNPDTTIDILRAQLAVQRGERREGQSILVHVVQEEPMNPVAWESLAGIALDRTTYVQSLLALSHLVPKLPSH